MTYDILKMLAPMFFLPLWLDFSLRKKSIHLALMALFFTSTVAFSSNFTFIFREIHQSILLLMFFFAALMLIKTKKIHKFNYIFLILLVFICISLVHPVIEEDIYKQIFNLIMIIGVSNYLYYGLANTLWMRALMLFIGQLAVIAAIVGLIEYGTGVSQRIEGTFSNPNYYAFFLGIGYCITHQVMTGLRRHLSLILIIVAIILSGSRVAIMFPIITWLWDAYRFNKIKHWITLGVSIIFLLGIMILSDYSRFSNTEATEGSDAERILLIKIAYRMAEDNPFTGVGWGRFSTEFNNYSSTSERIYLLSGVVDMAEQESRVSHNDLLRVLSELGWGAFIMTLILLVVGLMRIIKNKNHELNYISPVWLGIVIFSLTHNNLNSSLFWILFLLPFYFFKGKAELAVIPP